MQVKYGLPEAVEFCSRCTISNQRPNSAIEYAHTIHTPKKTILFTDGVCDACLLAERKQGTIDWEVRDAQLKKLCDRHRRSDGYDCIVPGSGGKDSFYAAWMLKYKYGMHPLTVTWAPNVYTDWGRRNHTRWIDAGFDNWLVTPSGKTHRLVTRLAVDNLLHPFQPFMLGQKNLAPKIAIQLGIPLIFYGENEAEYGNPISDNLCAKRDYSYFANANGESVFLGGVPVNTIKENYGLTDADLNQYMPCNPSDVQGLGIEVHYLGYYLKWHPQANYYHAVENGGFEASPERTPGTYSKYNSIDDKIDDLHYFTTYIKYGIGRATYDAAQEIRSGDITREEGVALVNKYDGEYPERFEKEIFDYLNVPGFPEYNRETFLKHCDNFKSPHLWDGDRLIHRVKSHMIGVSYDDEGLSYREIVNAMAREDMKV